MSLLSRNPKSKTDPAATPAKINVPAQRVERRTYHDDFSVRRTLDTFTNVRLAVQSWDLTGIDADIVDRYRTRMAGWREVAPLRLRQLRDREHLNNLFFIDMPISGDATTALITMPAPHVGTLNPQWLWFTDDGTYLGNELPEDPENPGVILPGEMLRYTHRVNPGHLPADWHQDLHILRHGSYDQANRDRMRRSVATLRERHKPANWTPTDREEQFARWLFHLMETGQRP